MVREALMARRIGRWLLFAVAAAVATRATWPGSPNGFATVIARIDVVTIVLLLAGLPWLARWFLGPASGRLARFLRAGGCGPVAAGGMAARRYRAPGSPQQLANARIWQGATAGFLATGIGGLIVTVLGTGTVALMPRAAWLRHLLYPGQHLLPAAAYSHELAAAKTVGGYGLILLIFPVIGLLLGMASGVPADSATSPGPSPGEGGPPGPPGPEPTPDPADGGRLADAGAGSAGPPARLPGWSDEGPDSEQDEVLAGVTAGIGLPAGMR
jgi:hypothetical protein